MSYVGLELGILVYSSGWRLPWRGMGRGLKIRPGFNFEQFICDQWERALHIY